jgi:Mg2+ and Co2+ transporter CorA
MPDAEKDSNSLWKISKVNPFRTSLNFGIQYPVDNLLRLPVVHEQWRRNASHMTTFVSQLLRHHTTDSVFNPRAIPHQRPGGGFNSESIFGLLLAESTWRLAVSTLETTLQGLRHKATKLAGDEAFSMLTDFRREVSDVQMLIAESRKRCVEVVEEAECWRVDGLIVNAYHFWSQKPGAPIAALSRHAQSMDIRNLPDALERLESRVNDMMQTINEEIQVVIGSVQVEDAKTMKSQTEKMKRQTEWTVVLAVLAAIYLPMTVVTGIFGMNIREMEAQTTMPDRWSVFKAWSVAFGATLGSIIAYATWRWPVRRLLNRREQLKKWGTDIEALKMQ